MTFSRTTARRLGTAIFHLVAVLVMLFCGLLTAFFAVIAVPENFADASTDELSNLGVVRFLVSLLLLCLIPFYRKMPLVLIIAGGLGALLIQADPYVLTIGLTVWLVRATRRWHWVIAGVGGLIALGNISYFALAVRHWDFLDPGEGTAYVLILGFSMLVTAGTVGFMTRQRRRVAQAHATVLEVEHDRDAIATAMTRQTEREFLAREVHDTLAQRLTALSLQTGRMHRVVETDGDPELSAALQETKQYSDQALKDLRNLVTSLRAQGEKEPEVPAVAPTGYADLRALLRDAADQGLTIQPQIMLNGYDQAPDDLQRAVLRILQEALTNVMRHSVDQTVELQLEGQAPEGLVLIMTNRRDESSPFADGTGTGLLGIKERARLLGGTAQEEYLPAHFRLTVRLPWSVTPDTQ